MSQPRTLPPAAHPFVPLSTPTKASFICIILIAATQQAATSTVTAAASFLAGKGKAERAETGLVPTSSLARCPMTLSREL